MKNAFMKTAALAAALLILVSSVLAFASCGGDKPAGTEAPGTTAAGPDNTAAPDTGAGDTTEAPGTSAATAADVTTEEVTTAEEFNFDENKFGELADAELQKLIDVVPALLPDGKPLEKFVRPYCLDDVLDKDELFTHYYVSGNSSPNIELVDTDGGAIYGKAFKIPAYGKTPGGDRAEIQVQSFYDANVKGAKGIMFYVDLSHTTPNDPTLGKPTCASVTINVNNYRANMADHGSVGYYFDGLAWNITNNVNACRMQLPDQFKGWVYIPATSFVNSSKEPIADADGLFPDLAVENMRCYTDGYVYSTDSSSYVIFDEILYIYD